MAYSTQATAIVPKHRAAHVNLPNSIIAYAFLLPAIIMLAAVTLYPIGFALSISLFQWELTARAPEFIGLANFERILDEPDILHSVRITAFFAAASVSGSFVLGLFLAVLLNRTFFANRVARALVLLPIMMSPIVVGFIFQMMFHASYGVINYLLYNALHVTSRQIVWLGEPTAALGTVIATDIWLGTPFVAIILLAGLQSLDTDVFEAARIDGASRWQSFRSIAWPLLRNPIMVAITIRTILAVRVFDLVYSLTQGGPAGYTEVLSFKAYRQGLEYFAVGYGSALTVLLILLTLVMVSIVVIVFDRLTRYY